MAGAAAALLVYLPGACLHPGTTYTVAHFPRSLPAAAVLCMAFAAGCTNETPAVPADLGIRDASPRAGSNADAPVSGVGAAAQSAPARPAKVDARVANGGIGDADATRLAEMQEPYARLSSGEAGYFDGKFLRSEAVGAVLRGTDFDSKVLDLQSGGDVNAMARQRAYADAFRQSLQPYADRAQLERIGCGTVLCMGSLRTSSKDWIGPWTIDLHKQPLPLPSLSVQTIRSGTDYEVRFAFTTTGSGGFTSQRKE
jgi:hypothetical protein